MLDGSRWRSSRSTARARAASVLSDEKPPTLRGSSTLVNNGADARNSNAQKTTICFRQRNVNRPSAAKLTRVRSKRRLVFRDRDEGAIPVSHHVTFRDDSRAIDRAIDMREDAAG